MKRTIAFIQIIMLNIVFNNAYNIIQTKQPSDANLPNSASVYCEQNDGVLGFKEDESGGIVGLCIFPDGSECEEWAYYRNECQNRKTMVLGATR